MKPSIGKITLSEFDLQRLSKYRLDDYVEDVEKNGLERIEEGAFSGCSGLKEVSFPRTLERIGYYSFSGCGLETLAIPDNVTTISDKAFRGCQNLNIITIGSGVKIFCYEIFCK